MRLHLREPCPVKCGGKAAQKIVYHGKKFKAVGNIESPSPTAGSVGGGNQNRTFDIYLLLIVGVIEGGASRPKP